MNESPNFLHTLIGLRQAPGMVGAQRLLDGLPQAAMLVDAQSLCIISANSGLCELSRFTLSELTGTPVTNLFADLDEEALRNPETFSPLNAPFTDLGKITSETQAFTNSRYTVATLIQRDQLSINVNLTWSTVLSREKLLLVVLEPHKQQPLPGFRPEIFPPAAIYRQGSFEFWEALTSLITAAQEQDYAKALDLVLRAGRTLTGAKVLAIYQVQDCTPQLKLQIGFGETHLLPEGLSLQELIYLNKPEQWEAGNRPCCTLHRIARAAQLSFVVTAPIGPSNAMIGLVAIAGDQDAACDFTLPLAQLMAVAVALITQQQARITNLQAELQAQSSLLRIKATLEEQMQEGIVVLTPSLQILGMNLTAEMILGYASREVVGQEVEKLLIGPETLLPALIAAQRGSPTYSLGNVRLYRRNGDAFLALVRVFPIMNGDQVEQIIVFVMDLSEQEEIRVRAEQLEQRALLGEVTAIFAHEVRNPINSISTGLQFMSMNLPAEDPSREDITRMMQDCDRLTELMKSVLYFSRPTDYEMETLDIPLMLKRLLDRLRPRIAKLNVKHDLQVDSACPPIRGNLRALEQVFINLITNALQAMGQNGGSLVLKAQPITAPEGRIYLEVSVADTGPGIPKELHDRVFQPFFTTERNGTGLGLAIAKRVVTTHKGNIWLDSVPGGTVFHVQIPAAGSEE